VKIFISGVAGFIGFSLAKNLLSNNNQIDIYGIDNFDNYYSKKIKDLRIKELRKFKKFKFTKLDITKRDKVLVYFRNKKFTHIVHLAAQAGVRFSQIQPKKYLDINIFGFVNIADACLVHKPKVFIYASSSSVYGDIKKLPAKEIDNLTPLNIYATSKKINEITARFYSNHYNLNFVGLRYFTVYGEWGRPDMFLFKLFKAYHLKKTFFLNNSGEHKRDFTYIDDVVALTKKIIFKKNFKEKNIIFNICSNNPIKITKIINFFKKNIGKVAIKTIKRNKLDVKDTHGRNEAVKLFTKFNKFTNYENGILNSYSWYQKNKIYKIK
jgi:UDP-glucuronate 4-epimerase